MNIRTVTIALLIFLTIPLLARAEDWPQWRGPHFNGSSDETGLPDTLNPQEAAWKTSFPGVGASTPIVSGNRIFVTYQATETKKLTVVCIDRTSGTICWSREVSTANASNKMADLSSCSPVADGKHVIFYFGTGDLACFDFDGNPIWSRNIPADHGAFNILWLYASSPLLYQGKLYIEVLQRDVPINGAPPPTPADSYLLAIDPQTGKDLWKHVRPSDALVESREAYTTPIPMDTPQGPELLIMGGDHLTGHDPATGREIWRSPTYNPTKINSWRTVCSACVADGLVIGCPPKSGTMFAVKPGEGDVPFAWHSTELKSDVCVPLLYKGKLYVLDGDQRILNCVDPKTGQKLWSGLLDPKHVVFRASPTGADGKIYLMNEAGDVWVVSADEFKVLSKASLASEAMRRARCRASITVADGQVFVRTADTVMAFGKGK